MELDPRTTAVVAVHCQGDIVGPDGAFASFFYQQVAERRVLGRIATLTDVIRAAGGTIVYTRVAWRPDFSDLHANSPILGIVAETGCLKDGSRLAKIVGDVAPHNGDIVITHQRVGGFAESDLDATLRDRDVDTLVFCGVATNFSVEGTARVASDLGYRVVVVDDACAAASPEVHTASLGSLGLLAEIVTVQDVLDALPSSAPANAKE
ncbi:isochorismatase family cysteine hydrolase [Nocardia sp. NPDC052112]|uniref:cysteine hydrolase family protein n=1 Tax=Nocardia sp. NPDC052112 TaxID=3155646 RepID=UPI003422E6C2